MRFILTLLLSISSGAVFAEVQRSAAPSCWKEAAQRYRLHPLELVAHACVESSLRPDALNKTHKTITGSVDIGLMQINSRWLPQLGQYGITDRSLQDPCINVMVGAWILSDLKSRLGDSWEATGAYNASCTTRKGEACTKARTRYAWKVYRAMNHLAAKGSCP